MATEIHIGLESLAHSEQMVLFRERARKARMFAARYRGEAASILIEIAERFDAKAARLEARSITGAVPSARP